MPKVSVVLPIYNVEGYIEKSLNRLIAQTMSDIEIVCVDDMSTDNTYQILKEYEKKDSRIKVFQQEHRYAGAARNLGLEKASGEYVMFLDPDDYYEEEMVEELYNKAKKDDTDVTICGLYYVYQDGIKYILPYYDRFKYYKVYGTVFSKEDVKDDIWKFHVYPVNKIYKRDFLNHYNIRFQDVQNTNDARFAYEVLIRASRISILDKAFYYYRFYRENNTRLTKGKNLNCVIEAYEDTIRVCKQDEAFSYLEDGLHNILLQSYIYHFATYCNKYNPDDEYYYNHIQSYVRNLIENNPKAIELLKEDRLDYHYLAMKFAKYKHKEYFKKPLLQKMLKHEITPTKYNVSLGNIPIFSYKQLPDKKDVSMFNMTLYREKNAFKYTKKYLLGVQIGSEIKKEITEYLDDIILKLNCEENDTVLIFNDHLGETFVASQIMEELCQKENIKNKKFVFHTKAQFDVIKMYLKEDFEYIIKPTSTHMRIAISEYLEKHASYSGINFKSFMPRSFWLKFEVKNNHFYKEILKHFDLSNEQIEFKHPVFSDEIIEKVKQKALQNNLNLNNFIFISPEALSISQIDTKLWLKLYEDLNIQGYDIYVNSQNKKYLTENTKSFFLSLDEAFILAEMSKGIIALRSGLVDVLYPTNINKHIIYNGDNRIIRNSLLQFPKVNESLTREYDFELNPYLFDEIKAQFDAYLPLK